MHWREIPGNEYAFDKLKAFVEVGNAIAFVGAGASAGLYPLWGRLLMLLADQAVNRGLATEEDRAFWLRMRDQRPQQVVRGIKEKLGEGSYAQALREIFRPKAGDDGNAFTGTHAALMRLPFRGYVTTNYDPGLLEARLELRPDSRATGWATWKDADSVHGWYTGDIFAEQPCPVLFAHGIYERSDTIVLGAGEYREAYRAGAYRRLFDALWGQEHLVFVGFGFSDPWLDFLADEVITQTGAAQVAEPRHVALIGLRDDETYSGQMREVYRDQYNSEVVFYPVTDDGKDHGALLDVLSSLDLRPVAAPAPVPTPPAAEAPPQRWVHETTEDELYVERSGVIERLERWVDDPEVRVVAVTGFGGLGKTSLVAHWLKQRGGDRRRSTKGLFYWSFYAERDVAAFLESLLAFAAEELRRPPTREATPVELAVDLLRQCPLLLVLDGLEVLQERPDTVAYGALLSDDLRDILDAACRRHDGLVVLTSRFPFPELTAHLGGSLRALDLDRLAPAEGATLLVMSGVEGSGAEREAISRRFEGHPLALRVFAAVLAEQAHGDPSRLVEQVFAAAGLSEDAPLERKLRHLLKFYERALPKERTALLGLVSLFRAPVAMSTLATLARLPAVSDTLGELSKADLERALLRLAHDKLVIRDHRDGTDEWSCHPILRDHFRQALLGRHDGIAGGIADLLTDRPSSERPTDIRALEPVLTAIEILLDAGDFERADELYQTRLENGCLFLHLPAPAEGTHCALGFVADEDRRVRCEAQLSAERFGFYLNEVALTGTAAGELTSAMAYFEAADAVDRREKDLKGRSIGLQNQAELLIRLGRLADAEAKAREALSLAREIEADTGTINSLAYVGTVLTSRGCIDDAMAAFEEANAIQKRIDPEGDELYSRRGVQWGDLLERLGRTVRTRALTEANMKICERLGWQDDVALCRWLLGRVGAIEGRLDAAVHDLSAAESIMRRGHLLMDLSATLLARGDVERRRGEWETARRYVEEALRIAMPRGMRLDHADGLVLRARLRFEQAKAERAGEAEPLREAALRAQDDLDAARSIARDCGYAWAERDALALLADTSTALGERDRALAFRRDAETLTAGLRLD